MASRTPSPVACDRGDRPEVGDQPGEQPSTTPASAPRSGRRGDRSQSSVSARIASAIARRPRPRAGRAPSAAEQHGAMNRRISSTSPASRNAPARCGPPSSRIEVTGGSSAPSWSSAERTRAGSFSPVATMTSAPAASSASVASARRRARDDHGQRDLVGAPDELGVERQARLGVEDDAPRLAAHAVDARGQLRVVGQRGADARPRRRRTRRASGGRRSAAVLAGDPLRVAGAGGDLAVERHRGLEEHPRAAGARVLAERLVEPARARGQLAVGARRPRRPRRAGCPGRGRRPSRSGRRRRRRRGRCRPSRIASVHGGVRPWWQHGSSET